MSEIVYRSGIKSGVIAFKAVKSITRPANVTQYAVSDLINANAATTLIEFDFGVEYSNQVIEINNISIMSSNGSAVPKLTAGVYLFNTSTILGAGDASQKDDNAAFAPTSTEVLAKKEASFEDVSNSAQIGTGVYEIIASEKCIEVKINSSGKIYAAIVANNTYTPASGEVLSLMLKGYILG